MDNTTDIAEASSPGHDNRDPVLPEHDGTPPSSGAVEPLDRTPDHHGGGKTPQCDRPPRVAISPHMLLTVEEAADFLTIGKTKLYQLLNSGQLRRVKIGGRTGISLASLEQFVQNQLNHPQPGRSHPPSTGKSATSRVTGGVRPPKPSGSQAATGNGK